MDLNGLKIPYLDVSVLFWEKRGESHSQWRESSEWPKEEQGEERRGLLRVLYDQIWERHKGEFHVRCYKKTCSIEDYQAVIYTCILIYRNLFYCLSKCSFISDHCQPIIYNWPFFFFFISQHLLSDCHQAFSKGDKYSVLDKVISTMHFNFSAILNQVTR